MNESSRITIEMLQTLIDSPRLDHLLSHTEKGVLLATQKQIVYLEEVLQNTTEALNKTIRESFL